MRSEKRTHRESIEQEIQGPACRGLLNQLHQASPPLRRFPGWPEMVAFMRDGNGEGAEKDDLLRAILAAHAQSRDPRWRTVLVAMFWPSLEAIHAKRSAWDEDQEDLWQHLLSIFLEVVCRIDAAKRPNGLVQKVLNDTTHRLHDVYRRVWRQAKIGMAVANEDLDQIAAEDGGIDVDLLDRSERQEREVKRLRQHLDEGRIGEADFLLLVGTRVYGRCIRDCAEEAGISFQTAKKRRQRAEAAIRRSEEEEPQTADAPVPQNRPQGASLPLEE